MHGNLEFHRRNATMEKEQYSGVKPRGLDVTARQRNGGRRERWKMRKEEKNGEWRAGFLAFFSVEWDSPLIPSETKNLALWTQCSFWLRKNP